MVSEALSTSVIRRFCSMLSPARNQALASAATIACRAARWSACADAYWASAAAVP